MGVGRGRQRKGTLTCAGARAGVRAGAGMSLLVFLVHIKCQTFLTRQQVGFRGLSLGQAVPCFVGRQHP